MKHSLECPRCRERRIWNLRNPVEHSSGAPAPLGAPQGLSPLEAFACDACGYTEWYSANPGALQPRPDSHIVDLCDHRFLCVRCQSREHLLVARFEEASHVEQTPSDAFWGQPARLFSVPLQVLGERGVQGGTFAVVICRSCGVMSWFGCGIPPLPSTENRCARCGHASLAYQRRVEEVGGHVLPLVMHGRHEVGHFHLELCESCGFVDWYAEGLDDLSPDGREILLLEGHKPASTAAPKTPYR